MSQGDIARLVSLAAIWGASFLFNRITAPVLGPVLTAELRTLIAGVALAGWFAFAGFDPQWRRWWPQYMIVGILSSAIPFLLWAYAALTLPAGLLSVLNATSPMWGALCSAVLLRRTTPWKTDHWTCSGLCRRGLGDPAGTGQDALYYPALIAALAAAFCYGLAAAYMKRWASDVPSRGMAVGTQLVAALLLIPFIPLWPPAAAPTPLVAAQPCWRSASSAARSPTFSTSA